jgi:hypothetical protein
MQRELFDFLLNAKTKLCGSETRGKYNPAEGN